MLINGFVILFNGIPLIDCDNGRLACLVRNARDLFVLLGNALGDPRLLRHNVYGRTAVCPRHSAV